MAFLALFGVGALAFIGGSELIVRVLVAPGDSFESYKATFRDTAASTVAFGDSHVKSAVASGPEILNLGYAGETLHLMVEKIRAYAARGHVKRVVVQYSPEQFAIYRADKMQTEMADELLERSRPWLYSMRPHFRRYLLEYWNAVLENPARLLGTRAAAAEAPEATAPPLAFSAWPAAEQRREAELRVQLHAPLPQGRTVERLLAQLFTTVDDLTTRGIETCFAEYPLSSAYRVAAASAPTFKALHARVRELVDERRLRFVDLTDKVADSHFSNSDHTLDTARPLVTRLLIDACFGTPQARSVEHRG